MVTKPKKQSGEKGKKRKVKVLNLNKETIKDLTVGEVKRVKGGIGLVAGSRTCSAQSCVGQSASGIRQDTFSCAEVHTLTLPGKCI